MKAPCWFVMMHMKNRLENDEAYFTAISLFDRVIETGYDIDGDNYRFVAAACFKLAEKSEEIYTTSAQDIL